MPLGDKEVHGSCCYRERAMKTRSHPSRTAFTLVEIMIVVAIIGVLLALAVPGYQKVRERALCARFINDVRVAAGAFQVYTLEQKGYPPNVGPGAIPSGMASYLGNFPWTQPTPLGGRWNWDYRLYGYKAGVGVYSPIWPRGTFLKIDEQIDDGDLAGGKFRERPNGYTFVIED